jgi:preprotein translocase subunit YajC
MNLLTVFLQQQSPQGSQSLMPNIIMFALIIVVFYFFMIRPQSKRMKEAKKFKDSLQKGQKVVTVGGIIGIIEEVKEDNVLLKTEEGKIRVIKEGISPESTASLNKTK